MEVTLVQLHIGMAESRRIPNVWLKQDVVIDRRGPIIASQKEMYFWLVLERGGRHANFKLSSFRKRSKMHYHVSNRTYRAWIRALKKDLGESYHESEILE